LTLSLPQKIRRKKAVSETWPEALPNCMKHNVIKQNIKTWLWKHNIYKSIYHC